MGQEIACTAKFEGKESDGVAMLETDYVLFRGDFRIKIAFAAMKSVKAADDWLAIQSPEGSLKLLLGTRAEKWAQKILHPPTLFDKLGVKPGLRVRVIGAPDFAEELARCGAIIVAKSPDMIFFKPRVRQTSRGSADFPSHPTAPSGSFIPKVCARSQETMLLPPSAPPG